MSQTTSSLYPSPNGDLVIQTSDGVLFGVHSLLLKLSSSVMDDMLTVGSGRGDRTLVTITEDSAIFRDLLSFIYPDKAPARFTTLTSLMPVLDAAAKYDMKGVAQSLGAQLMTGVTEDALLYQDPLWVYIKAKQLDLTDLAKAAANATLTIDLGEAPYKPEVANAPASWILELLTLRSKHSQWWSAEARQPIRIARMNSNYQRDHTSAAVYRQIACQCPQLGAADTIQPSTEAVLKINERPCAKSVRKIDFNRTFGCLRCGAAATAHYNQVCQVYEKNFGKF